MYLPNTTTTLLSKAKCLIAKKKEEEESEVSEKIINFLVVNDRIFPTLNKYLESMTISIQDISVGNKVRYVYYTIQVYLTAIPAEMDLQIMSSFNVTRGQMARIPG